MAKGPEAQEKSTKPLKLGFAFVKGQSIDKSARVGVEQRLNGILRAENDNGEVFLQEHVEMGVAFQVSPDDKGTKHKYATYQNIYCY